MKSYKYSVVTYFRRNLSKMTEKLLLILHTNITSTKKKWFKHFTSGFDSNGIQVVMINRFERSFTLFVDFKLFYEDISLQFYCDMISVELPLSLWRLRLASRRATEGRKDTGRRFALFFFFLFSRLWKSVAISASSRQSGKVVMPKETMSKERFDKINLFILCK